MAKKKILCFGELLLRISPSVQMDAAGKQPLMVFVGGAEANVATALAGWDLPVKYCTALPDNFMSRYMMNYLEYHNIYTSSILFSGNRIGLYYLDSGADLKGSMVYDRAHSSFSELKPGMIDWDRVLADVSWFNFSAISPALSHNLAEVCLEGVRAAAAKGIPVSIDLNYRSRLWKYGKHPADIMPELVQYCNVVMGNIWSANSLLGIPVDEKIHDHKSKQAYLDHAEQTSREIINRFPVCHTVANTFRFDSAEENILYYTSMFTNGQSYESAEFSCKGVADRSGSGDCFMAGLIYGLYRDNPAQEVLNYATAAAFGKLQELGDATGQDVLHVMKLGKGG